jgi:hypothetical protein
MRCEKELIMVYCKYQASHFLGRSVKKYGQLIPARIGTEHLSSKKVKGKVVPVLN